MRKATLTRLESSDEGTFGELVTDTGFTCVTAELPWRDLDGNGQGDPNLSCVTPGTYRCVWVVSPRYGYYRYRLEGVPGRLGVLIHRGNFAGDIRLGLKRDVSGCILLGKSVVVREGQKALADSRAALAAFEKDRAAQPFELTIRSKITPR